MTNTAQIAWAKHDKHATLDYVQSQLAYGGKPTKFKAIIHKGELASIVSTDYVLLPNESALEVAETVARKVGAVAMTGEKFKGDWIGSPLGKHVIEDGCRMHALYVFGEPVVIQSETKGDKLYMGFTVHNSIDGTLGFGVAGTCFRQACSNMVFFGHPKKLAYHYNEADWGETLRYAYVKHVTHLLADPKKLERAMLSVVEASKAVVATYKLWTKLELNKEIAERIAQAMPKKYLPDYFVWDKKEKHVAKAPNVPLWNVYNDVTAALWHNVEIGLRRKKEKMESLEKAMPLRVEKWAAEAEAQGVKL